MENVDTSSLLTVDLNTRITNKECRQILDICGIDYQAYAKALKITQNGLSTRFWQRPHKQLTLFSIDKLKEVCTEKNFYLALKEIREQELRKQGVQHKHP